MKGIQGLILAIGLGIAGALFNWAYLARKTSDMDLVKVIGIAPHTTVNIGESLTLDHLAPIEVPLHNWDNLKNFAYKWSDRQTVVSMPVRRTLPGGSLLLQDDLRTPPPKIRFEDKKKLPEGTVERGMFVPFQTKNFVSSLVNPGQYVEFMVPQGGSGVPTPAAGGDPPRPTDPEILGPFKILSLGNRLGPIDVMIAAGMKPTQENVMLISIKLIDGQMEPKARKLWDLLNRTNFQQVSIMIRPPDEGE